MKPLLLDLFCKAGGAAKGYQRAGFHVVGVDIEPQPRYCGDEFVQADALRPPFDLRMFDAIHASPPCQAYCLMKHLGKNAGVGAPDLIGPVRVLLASSGVPWVIENVVGAPLIRPMLVCGSYFGLDVRRHRLFEFGFANHIEPWCKHRSRPRPIAVYGDHPQGCNDKTVRINRARTINEARRAMGIDWMEWHELTQAIPPAYTEFIGKRIIEASERSEKTA